MASRNRGRQLDGLLILDKPAGISSNHALQKVKRLFNAQKAGHTGALDPLATGLLPICFGEATKFSQLLLDANKRYQATACLGVRTDSSDADGQVLETKACDHITPQQIEDALAPLRGNINQVPSMFSALKHQGQPLYKLARAGKKVAVKPRNVTVFDLTCHGINMPCVQLDITCSKGTYVRSIVEDLGQTLGCGAHVSMLRRLSAGPFHAEQMVTMAQLAALAPNASSKNQSVLSENAHYQPLDALLLPTDTAVLHLNAVQLPPQQTVALQQGKTVIHPRWSEQPEAPNTLLRVYDDHNVFIGLATISEQGTLSAKRLLRTS